MTTSIAWEQELQSALNFAPKAVLLSSDAMLNMQKDQIKNAIMYFWS